MKFILKPYRWAIIYGLFLLSAFTFILLDAFVIPRELEAVVTPQEIVPTPATTPTADPPPAPQVSTAEPVITESSYWDEHISITIEMERLFDTSIY